MILQVGFALAQFRNTGNFYAMVKRCSIPSTSDEHTAYAKKVERVPGKVRKTPYEPHELDAKETGKVLKLDYRLA